MHGNPAGVAGKGGAGGGVASGGNGGAGASMALGAAGSTDAGNGVSRICSLSGRFSAINADGSCPVVSELATYSPNNNVLFFLGIYSDSYNGPLPKCSSQSPYDGGFRYRFRVEQVKLGSHVVDSAGQQTKVFDSVIYGANLDANPVCGASVSLNSVAEQVSLAPGTLLFVAQRTVVRSDSDQVGAYVIYDQNGAVLYAYLANVRLDQFAGDLGDLLAGLGVTTSSDIICRVPDADMSLVSATLSTGSDTCQVDSHSERCCTLWSRTYEVQMIAALGPTSSRPYSIITFTLRAPGFIVKAQ